MPFFSVIIPAYNRAQLIGRTLQTALAQEFSDYEIIVVDDGSTDETATISASFGSKVRVMARENAGPGAARNAGIAHATGDYIVFLDSDDLFFPWTLSTYRDAIVAHHHPAMVLGRPLYWHNH